MKKAYFGISLSNRPLFDREIGILQEELSKHQINLWVFVDHYRFGAKEEKQMMAQAFKDIDESDFLIAEVSKKAIGVGIEVGYAYAKNKPILYLKKQNAPYSTTTRGCANYFIDYQDLNDLQTQLRLTLPTLLSQ